MYINFWYPVCTVEELTADAPLRVEILKVRLVAFRDADGKPRVLSDTCVHRGGSLGKGKVTDGNVACPYHGWQFDGEGICKKIPVLGEDAKIPKRAKVDAYPTQEKYGIVFAFLGDLPEAERPALYDIPEYDKEGWRANDLVTFEIDAYYERSVENGLDPAHNEFVHDRQGNVRFKPETMTVDTDDFGTLINVGAVPPEKGTTELENLRTDDQPDAFGASTAHWGPNTLITAIRLSAENQFVQYFFEQPISEKRTRIFFVNMRNCMLDPESDQRIIEINMEIAQEDINVVHELYPVRTPESTTKEILVTGDECIGAYRKHLKEWEKRGWRVDMRTMRDNDGDIAYAIPSPARRELKGWVIDTIPLLDAE